MNENWTTSRVVTVMLLGLVLVTGWIILRSLDHQQEKIIALEGELRQLREIRVHIDGLDRIVVQHNHSGGYVPVPLNGSAPHAPSSDGRSEASSLSHSADGKDEIGRPLRETPGFTLEPPLGVDIPGRTVPRAPEFVPELGGMWVHGSPSLPDKANAYLTNDGVLSRQINPLVHERLLDYDPDDPVRLWPELAVAWETADDHLTYRFHLRKGVVFSDGSPFDADDIVFSYQTLMDPEVESEHLKGSFIDVDSVVALDRYTVEVRMRKKYWKALKQFGYGLHVLPKEHFEKAIPARAAERGIAEYSVRPGEPGFGAVFNTFTRDMSPGTGPYLWKPGESWVTNQHITLYANERAWIRSYNPDYFRLARMRWRQIKDRIAQFEEFRKGGIDIIVVDHDKWDDELSKDPTVTRVADHYEYDHIGLLFTHMPLNNRTFPFNDVAVRRALAHLVNRQAILDELERGRGSIATCPTKPIYPEYSHDIEPRRFDPQLAKRILAEAGWRDTDGDGWLDKDGRKLEFTLSTPSARVWFVTVSTLLKDACKSIGVECHVDPKDWSNFVEQLREHTFQATILYASAPDPWRDVYEEFHSSQSLEGGGNYQGWTNAEADRLLEAMREEFDDDKRVELFHRFNHIFHDEVPELLLLHGKVGVLINKRFQGVRVFKSGMKPFPMWIKPEDWRE